MVEGKTVKFSKDDQDALQHLSDLLHLFNHRNKNQHRQSIWWRHFSVFRRQLSLLLDDVKALHDAPRTHLERTRKKARDKQTQAKIIERLDFWQSVLVSKWQRSFSQVIADGRFAVLGLVLVAILAQVCQITGITAALDDLGQVEVEKVITKFGEEDWEAGLEHEVALGQGGEDIGVAILRDDQTLDTGDIENATATGTRSAVKSKGKRKAPASKPTLMPTKKKRKKGNTIDDLFSGLA